MSYTTKPHNQLAETITDFDAKVDLNAKVIENTEKISYTDASEVAANTLKVGITPTQASAITTNSNKISFPGFTTIGDDYDDSNYVKLNTTSSQTFNNELKINTDTVWHEGNDAPLEKINRAVNVISHDYMVTLSDTFILNTRDTVIFLPDPAVALPGKEYIIKNVDSRCVLVGEIDGRSEHNLESWQCMKVIAEGGMWFITHWYIPIITK
jgi:hypothetical protein